MPRRSAARPLGLAITQLIRDLGFEKKLKEQDMILRWPDIVGGHIAEHARAVACEGGTLFVEVQSAAWRHELVYMKSHLIERLNQEAGSLLIQDIILTNRRK